MLRKLLTSESGAFIRFCLSLSLFSVAAVLLIIRM